MSTVPESAHNQTACSNAAESTISLAGCPRERLAEPGTFRGTVAQVRGYGGAVLLLLHERCAEGHPLAVSMPREVLHASEFNASRHAIDSWGGLPVLDATLAVVVRGTSSTCRVWGPAVLDATLAVVVRGSFRHSAKAPRITLDALTASDINISLSECVTAPGRSRPAESSQSDECAP